MTRVLRSPARYVQGTGEMERLYEHFNGMGKKILFIVSESGKKRVEDSIERSFSGTEISYEFAIFSGECEKSRIEELCSFMAETGCDVVAGAGGGKILDTAKAVAYYTKCPVAILPTVASTDAPCSALSVLYTKSGEFDRYLFLRESPNLVLVDINVIAQSSPRLLTAGMGDALATYFEARAVQNSGSDNQTGGKPTGAAWCLAVQCYQTLLADGLRAKCSLEAGALTPALENIVEVNTYLSGIGFESGGLGAAHAIQKGFTVLPELHHVYHGEKVAFGVLAQLVMENAPTEELETVMSFCVSVGLPVTFAQLGIGEATMEKLTAVAERSAREGMTSHNMPFAVTADTVLAGLLGADALGKAFCGA